MKKIRILFFVPFMNGGGAERVVLTLLHHLDRDRFEPVLVMMKREGRYLDMIPKDINVIDLGASQARYAIFKIIKVIREQKPDIVFATLAYLNLIIALIRPLLSKKITFMARESNTVSVRNKQEKYPKLFDFLYKKVYQNFDIVVTQAQYMRDDLHENYHFPKEKMVIIYNPINTQEITQKLQEKGDLGYHDRYHLLAVGKLGYQKGYDMMLSIMTRLDDSYYLSILGEGADKEKLEAQILELDLSNRVCLLGFEANPFRQMKEADLLLLSSRYEGLPNVVLEAAYCGRATVAFDAPGGVGEIIEEGFNGFLVPAFDEAAFADAIKRARAHDFDAEAISKRSEEKYAVRHIIQQYEKLFLEQGA